MTLRNKLSDTTRKKRTKNCKKFYRTNDLVSPENQLQRGNKKWDCEALIE